MILVGLVAALGLTGLGLAGSTAAEASSVRPLPPGWTMQRTDVGTLQVGPMQTETPKTALLGFTTYLKQYPIYSTGTYVQVVTTGPPVPVLFRSFYACFAGNPSWQSCQSGRVYFANGYSTCALTCNINGFRGSHACGVGGGAVGYEVDVSGCGEVRRVGAACNRAVSVYEVDKVRVSVPLAAFKTFAWHINAYYTGGLYGPYQGIPTC